MAPAVNPYDELRIRCGFGRAGLCCTDCLQGPCRISPFQNSPTTGWCGRDSNGIVAAQLLRLFSGGMGTLASEAAAAGQPIANPLSIASLMGTGSDNGYTRWAGLLAAARQMAGSLVMSYPAIDQPDDFSAFDVETGVGPLNTPHPRLLVAGQIPLSARQALVSAGQAHHIQVLGMAGSEDLANGVPWVGGFVGQQTILDAVSFTGLVAGSGCVQPSLLTAAKSRHIPIWGIPCHAEDFPQWATEVASATNVPTNPGKNGEHLPSTITAEVHNRGRSEESVSLWPGSGALVTLGMEPDIRTIADGRRPGLALITGCGVRPGEAVSIAQELLQRRVPCLAAGCVAPELAEAGLLYSLKGLPPVIYLGTCRQASRAIQLAERLRDLTGRTDLPLMVAVPGICQPSMAAIALGLAAQGARVHCGAGLPTVGSQEVANWLAAGERYAAGPLFSETEPPTARQIVARLLG